MHKLEQEQRYARVAMQKREQLCASESKNAQVIASTKTKKKKEKNTTYKSYKTKQNKKPKLELKITQNMKQLILKKKSLKKQECLKVGESKE